MKGGGVVAIPFPPLASASTLLNPLSSLHLPALCQHLSLKKMLNAENRGSHHIMPPHPQRCLPCSYVELLLAVHRQGSASPRPHHLTGALVTFPPLFTRPWHDELPLVMDCEWKIPVSYTGWLSISLVLCRSITSKKGETPELFLMPAWSRFFIYVKRSECTNWKMETYLRNNCGKHWTHNLTVDSDNFLVVTRGNRAHVLTDDQNIPHLVSSW